MIRSRPASDKAWLRIAYCTTTGGEDIDEDIV